MKLIQAVSEMCIEANLKLSEDMEQAVRNAAEEEDSVLGKQILGQLCENLDIAAADKIQFVRIPEWLFSLSISDRTYISKE